MATSPLTSAGLLANPTLSANAQRYCVLDNAGGIDYINRTVQQLRFFLRWKLIDGQFYEIRGHEPDKVYVKAEFYDHAAAGTSPAVISAATPYLLAAPGVKGTTSQQLALKEITARFDSRGFTDDLLSHQYNQVQFQKAAIALTLTSLMERAFIYGDSSAATSQFDGLEKLINLDLGQNLLATPSDQLNIFNEAMAKIRTRRRSVDLIVMNQDAWRRVLELQRAKGLRPEFRHDPRVGQEILHVEGVPVCISDHIVTSSKLTSVFFLCLDPENGVFGLKSRRRPRAFFTEANREDSPFRSYVGHQYCALASATNDSLVEVVGWNVGIAGV